MSTTSEAESNPGGITAKPVKTYRFVDDYSALTRWTITLLSLWLICSIYNFNYLANCAIHFSNAHRLIALSNIFGLIGKVSFMGVAAGVVFYVCAEIFSFVLFMFWVYYSCAFCHALGAKELKHTPGWAVGFFFIPIANLIVPFEIVQEVWRVSVDVKEWKSVKSNAVISLWWTLIVLIALTGYFTDFHYAYIKDFTDTSYSAIIEALIFGYKVISTALSIYVIAQIHRNLLKRRKEHLAHAGI